MTKSRISTGLGRREPLEQWALPGEANHIASQTEAFSGARPRRCQRCFSRSGGLIDHRRARLVEVVVEHHSRRCGDVGALQRVLEDRACRRSGECVVHGEHHEFEPGISLRLADGKRQVTHAKPGVSSLVAVGAGPAPVLNQEQCCMTSSIAEVFGVERLQHGIVDDVVVEVIDDVDEELRSADSVEQRDLRRLIDWWLIRRRSRPMGRSFSHDMRG